MKKKIIICSALLAVATIVVIFFLILKNNFLFGIVPEFDGSRVRTTNPDRFYLEFEVMNGDDSEVMYLDQGDVLQVSWKLEKGKMDFVIKMGDDSIYKANNRVADDENQFKLEISNSGYYTIYINAKNAKGEIEVSRN